MKRSGRLKASGPIQVRLIYPHTVQRIELLNSDFILTDIKKNASVSSVQLMSVQRKFDKVFTINSIQIKKEGKWYSMDYDAKIIKTCQPSILLLYSAGQNNHPKIN